MSSRSSGMRERLQRIERGLEDPHVDVLDLVNWVYSEQRAAVMQYRGNPRLSYGAVSADGVARIAELNRLGVRVDVSGSDQGELHPVAETIHFLVCREIKSIRSPAWLIPHYGEHAQVPEGYDLEVELAPAWKGEPRYELGWCSGCRSEHLMPAQKAFKVKHDGSNAKVPVECPLEWSHGPEYQAELRREYEHWHMALRRLVEACKGRSDLGRLIVTGPKIAREPWRDRGEPELPPSRPRPSRHVESSPTRALGSPVEALLLAILADAARGDVLKASDGTWLRETDRDALVVGEAMVRRLVHHGLAFYVFDSAGRISALDVTADGHAALKAGRLAA